MNRPIWFDQTFIECNSSNLGLFICLGSSTYGAYWGHMYDKFSDCIFTKQYNRISNKMNEDQKFTIAFKVTKKFPR